MIWSRLSKWLLPSVKIIQPGCWSCHQHSKAASAVSDTFMATRPVRTLSRHAHCPECCTTAQLSPRSIALGSSGKTAKIWIRQNSMDGPRRAAEQQVMLQAAALIRCKSALHQAQICA